jgi:hypothetical protein
VRRLGLVLAGLDVHSRGGIDPNIESSRPAELPRQPLSEPYVTVSRHTALLVPSAGK